ncbi:putative bifunctional diguanylate cyclase/phosphodiesterase [Mycolicibacterium hippocampi]|uniref:GGDEF-domain containing protein n=1 Tax=Mycolicibacterium hippocampi TaxID=659824 RepID=A0A7I9ZNX8_9MYCO|nr:GGDEF domain-containing phosphodiesterase [Mycolicibacterium hippocampi]GFH02761.1 GGDEF-domain containing protein [Mycolicibacterium hippocampi]
MPNPRPVVAALFAVGAGFSVLQLTSWSTHPTVRFGADLVMSAFALFAVGCALAAARRAQGRRRTAWICMGVGAGGFAAGQLVWGYIGLVHGTLQFQSVADVGYALLPVGAGLALLFFLGDHPRSMRLRVLLDGVIVAGALFGAMWVTLLDSIYTVRVQDALSMALTLAYPVAGIALVTIALLLLVRVPSEDRSMMVMLTLGLVLIMIADTAYAYVTAVEGQYYEAISLGYAWGFLAIAGAAMLDGRTRPMSVRARPRVPSRASMSLPFVPVTIAVALCAPVLVPTLGALYIVGIITVFAVMIRQLLLLTENRRLLAEVSDQLMRDPLTGLANRTLFQDRLEHAMHLHRSERLSVGVLLIDLDDFKLVNDSLGHPAGDAMLVRVGERLAATVRAGDTVARLGGDEFAVLMEGDAAATREAAQHVVHAFDRSFDIDGQDLLVRPSVGLAVAGFTDAALTADELLKRADVAMYTAKRSRSRQLVAYAPDMELHRGLECVSPAADPQRNGAVGGGSARLLGELRHAIEHRGLSAVYQPKFEVRTGRIVGAEALVRWPHPRYGLLVPDEFLPLVREHGLMESVTSVMLDLALDDAAEWYANGVGVPVAVNVFAPSISDTDLPAQIMRALERTGLSPDTLTVEITEDVLLENMAETRSVFAKLRDCGIRIAIDDFGSGYSALWYLREFPIDEVKLDREFITPILTQPTSAAIVRAVIDLAHVLGVTPVAEGVEDAETAAELLAYGCDIAQGFHYSRPLDPEAMLALLRSTRQACDTGEPVCADDYPAEGFRRKEIELMQ